MSGTDVLLPMTCSRCGGDLEGEAQALICTCAACRLAFYMPDPSKSYPVRFVGALVPQEGPRVYAPFWRLTGRLALEGADPAKEAQYKRAKPLGALFFPAFWSPRLANFDNLTLRYALLDPGAIQQEEGVGEALGPGMRDPSILPEMAALTWLAYLDRRADVTGVSAVFHPESLLYVGVPFFRTGASLVDGLCGVRLPASLL